MDALSFLIGRKWPSSSRLGLLLLLSTILCWGNLQAAILVPKFFPSVFANGAVALLWGFLVMVAGLLAIATSLGVILIVPLYSFYRISNTLQAWIRQRALEEMLCTGMTGRAILDGLVGFGTRWWLTASLPGALASIALFPELREVWMLPGVVLYLLLGAALGYLMLATVAWSSFPGGKAIVPMLGPICVVQLPPTFAVLMAGFQAPVLIVGSLYMILVGRFVAIYGLENWESLSRVESKTRRLLRRRMTKKAGAKLSAGLSENPIAARESMRGMDPATLSMRILIVSGFLLTTVAALSTDGSWAFLFLLGPVVLFNSYRGASTMSQIVTQETESSTLETVRSTPMSSDDFLKGWLQAVVVPQWKEHGLLLAGVFAVVVGMGDGALLANGMVAFGVCLSLLLPLASAYIGASIAGQSKTRGQISGQLFTALASMMVLGGPQVMASTQLVSLPVSVVALVAMTAVLCWVLDAGSKKSLNRVFLPQR